MTEIVQGVILGLVEGVTEFIPVSSTGHLIVVGHLIGFEGAKASTFDVFIQLGAILSVLWLYKERFLMLCSFGPVQGFAGKRGIMLLGITTIPALAAGYLAHGYIKLHLFNPLTVAIGSGLGAVWIFLTERFLPRVKKSGIDSLQWHDALAIGLFQCLSLWPGVSRSAATILGGMSVGIERKTAAEYSFLAAVPVMFAATTYDLYKSLRFLDSTDIPVFVLGFGISFISALLAIRFFIGLLKNHTLYLFAWYRVALTVVILWVLA